MCVRVAQGRSGDFLALKNRTGETVAIRVRVVWCVALRGTEHVHN